MTDQPKLTPTITVMVNGESREITMSFGLLNELVGLIGSAGYVGLVPTDADMSRGVLTAVLSKRDERGKIVEEVNLFGLDMTPAETMTLFQWVMAHVLDFFLSALETAAAVGQRFNRRVTDLFPQSQTGSDGSPSATPSAGPST